MMFMTRYKVLENEHIFCYFQSLTAYSGCKQALTEHHCHLSTGIERENICCQFSGNHFYPTKLHDVKKTWIITLCNITQFTSVEKCFHLHKFTVNPLCALRFWSYGSFAGLEEQELREHAADPQHVQGSPIWDLRSKENRQGDCCLLCPLSHRLLSTPWQNHLGHLVCEHFPKETPLSKCSSPGWLHLSRGRSPCPSASGEHSKDAKDSVLSPRGLQSSGLRHQSWGVIMGGRYKIKVTYKRTRKMGAK